MTRRVARDMRTPRAVGSGPEREGDPMSTRDHALELLRAYRGAKVEHDLEGDRLRAESITAVDAARAAGMPWDAIAEFLGYDNGHALRMWHTRQRDSQFSADQGDQWWKEANG